MKIAFTFFLLLFEIQFVKNTSAQFPKSSLIGKSEAVRKFQKGVNVSQHYWILKPYLNPHLEEIRVNPSNYIDQGIANPESETSPCASGYEELCGIYVEPDPSNLKQPHFNEKVNEDIYRALKKNEFLEKKVFLKDL